MEKHIRESINDEIVRKAGMLYDVSFEDIKYHGGFENFIYVFEKDKVEYILRLVHSDHKIYDYVLAEIEFIDYLAHNGACVSTVVHSKNNEIIEKIMINEADYFSVCVFVRGLGDRIGKNVLNPEFWQNLGLQIGLLHKLTKDFNPKHKRPIWYDDTLYQIADKALADEPLILQRLKERIDLIKTLPSNKDNYGLIHTDLHVGNMVIDEDGNLTFFDFDDSAYKHFISDIAIVIFYTMAYQNPPMEVKNDRAVFILKNFFEGYNKNNSLAKEELERLQDFLKLRELTLYTAIKAGGEEVINSDFGKVYLSIYKDKIINNEDFIDLEYVLNEIKM
jgi:Ser/Thr protein kinase RdoA (MazF antagonist)